MRALTAPDGTPEILALRALKLGDLLVAVPALKALRRGFPDHRLIVATTPWLEPIVDLVEGLDALVPTLRGLDDPLPMAAGRVELGVNLHGNGPESRLRLREIAPERTLEFRVPALDPGAGPEDPRPLWIDGELERARWAREEHMVVEELDDDSLVIEVPFGSTDWLLREVLKGAGDFVVLEPDDAREAVRRELETDSSAQPAAARAA